MNLIQFGRYGDILNVLPAATSMVVAPEFATLFDGVSYCTPIVRVWDLTKAIQEFPDAKVTIQGHRKHENFAFESWQQTGLSLEEWHSRPLVFDRRDKDREERQFGNQFDGKVVYNFSSHSSRFYQGNKVRRGLRKDYVDISQIRAERLYDMLWILERAKGLITVDTSLLWLSYVTKIPTVAIGPDDPYLFAPPRKHWIERLYFSEWALMDVQLNHVEWP